MQTEVVAPVEECGLCAPRALTPQPVGGNRVMFRGGDGATPAEIAASTGGPVGGPRVGQSAVRQTLLGEADGVSQCWRCGGLTTDGG